MSRQRQKQSRPTGANFDDFVFSYEDADTTPYATQDVSQQEDNSSEFWGRVGSTGGAILEGLSFLPGGVRDTVVDATVGFDPNDAEEMARRERVQQEKLAYKQKYKGGAFEGSTDAALSLPYSLTTMGSALGAGALAAPAGPVAAGVAGMAASGTTSYRASVAEFERTLYGASANALGRSPTDEEWGKINATFSAEATKYGLWEAGPEAISNLLMAKILGPLGSQFKGGVKGLIGRVAGLYGEELVTETVTQKGQGGIEAEVGMRENAPGWGNAFSEIAPATIWQTTLMAGGKKGIDLASRHFRNGTGGDGSGPLIDEPAQEQGAGNASVPFSIAESSEFGKITGPEWDAPAHEFDEASWNREAAYRGWNHYRTDNAQNTDDPFLSDDDHAEIQRFVREHGETSFSASLNSGETVDLLSWGGAEENPAYILGALPQGEQRLALPMAGVQGALGLPAGTGAMPMGTASTGRDTIATPTEFVMPTVATPYTPRPALPQFTTQGLPQGRWAGGRSQLAYSPKQEPTQGMDFMGQSVPSQAVPTQAQITSMQEAPRADTTAQADALGMPAPQAMPDEVRQNLPIPDVQPVTGTLTPQVAPTWEYGLPSFVTAQHMNGVVGSVGDEVTTKESRADLLRQLSPESLREARRMTNDQLRAQVAAERNPVPFSGDTIGYTREDYPMPTAVSGTGFTSPSGRRMAPFPQVDYSTPKKHRASNARVAQWLLEEARKEAAPNEWRTLMLRGSKADNLSPADVNDLIDILLNGVEKEVIPQQLKSTPVDPASASEPQKKSREEDMEASTETVQSQPKSQGLSEHFAAQLLRGKKYGSIVQARKDAAEITGSKVAAGTEAVKELDEAVELGVVKTARETISAMRKNNSSDVEIFRAMVDLYSRQPNLSSRTSTSIAMQAYSTPVPLAFLASHLAGVTDKTVVYEPTAGNGMLLIEANPENVVANELSHDRAERLRTQGFTVTENDAVINDPENVVDVVIANPPFGRVRGGDGRPVSWEVSGYETKELDHAIALKALDSLAERGRAVLIVGGKRGDGEMRSAKYQSSVQRQFWRALFDNYKVVDHFAVDGKMYERQGAGYPVDFIVINGKGRTEDRKFPAAALPRVYENFEALEELIHERRPAIQEGVDAIRGGGKSDDPGVGWDKGSEESARGSKPPIPVGDSPVAKLSDRRGARDGAGSVPSGDMQPGTGRGEAGGSGFRADRHSADSRRQLSGAFERDVTPDRGGVSEQDGRKQQAAELSAQNEYERVGGTIKHSIPRKLVKKQPSPAISQKATEHQLPYTPSSSATSMGTLVPRNMASPLKDAMSKLESARGDIDSYVAKELGYSPAELKKYFAGEQVDAIGLAIDNISRGSGFIIGDQTGIGKGRVNAAIIRYAQQKDMIPVFVTMKPDLYADMIRDLRDIGVTDFTPLATNAGLSGEKAIPLPSGGMLRTGDTKKHAELLIKAADNGVQDYDAVFTTYDQLSPSQNESRRDFMRAIAPRALFILDESHNAGGSDSGKQQRTKKGAKPVRAEFVREMLAASPHGAFYSSATYAKRPDVMSLYFKTDMRHAVDDIGMLAEAISAGGVPLQQVVAAQLTESGQYIRRERSFEGASVEVTHAKAELQHAEQSSTIMRAIHAFDAVKQKALKDVKHEAKGDGDSVGDSNVTGEKGASSTNFTSIMHNLIGQSLLAMKAQSAADEAAAAVGRGEKPVITLANTMGSFIAEHVEKNSLSVGQEVTLSFKDLFARYLEKTRTLTRRDSRGNVIESRLMTDAEVGESGVNAYENALSAIRESSFGDLPISPIDFIASDLEQRGIAVGEITGRTHAVEYRDGVPHYRPRKTSPAQNIDTMQRFNNGKLDAIILNQSGSTGISLHSSVTFEDQRKRTMIIVQPELNIDVFMQTLGRVFRTGQVIPPAYKLLTSDIPAEKRPAAVLGKKMAGLNANTTASRKTDTTFQNIPDFLNVYGDVVTAQIMEEDTELHTALGNPLKSGDSGLSREDAVRKVTGRIPMLPIKEQQSLYDRIESEYKELVAQLEATGGSTLEAKTLPLDARILESSELTPVKEDDSTQSPFAAPSWLGLFDVKVLGKPYTPDQVESMIAKGKESAPESAGVTKEAAVWLRAKIDATENEELREKLRERTDAQREKVQELIEGFPVGLPVNLSTSDASFSGVVTRVEFKGKGNPVAPSAWSMTVAVADAAKHLTIPFSKIITDASGEIGVGGALVRNSRLSFQDIMAQFERGQMTRREKRYIAYGNVLAAYAAVGGNGHVINFEDNNGNVKAGIIFKKDADKGGILGAANVSLPDFPAVLKFFTATQDKGVIKTADGSMTISTSNGQINFVVPASKTKGAQFFLNGKLLEAAGRDFVKTGNSMAVKVNAEKAELMVGVLRDQGFGLVAGNHIEEARKAVGLEQGSPRASIAPAQFLPPRKVGKTMRVADVQRTADAFGGIARASAPVQVVQGFGDLPQRLRDHFKDQAADVEAVYDPKGGTVYFVADNLTSIERTAEVWMHEQVVHHGLRSLLSEGDRKHILSGLWESSGGMGNAEIAEIAHRYGLRPTLKQDDRALVMEEYIASLAEKNSSGLLKSSREKGMWRRFVEVIARVWRAMVAKAAGGRVGNASTSDIEKLLSALGEHVMGGLPQGGVAHGGALASLGGDTAKSDAPLASLVDKLTDLEKVMTLLKNENIQSFFTKKTDLTTFKRVVMLPHWIAKRFPQFGVIYSRQLRRMDERSADKMQSLQEVPTLFGDKKDQIKSQDMDDLRKLIWDNEGKQIAELESTQKFLEADMLANGRAILKVNPAWYKVYEKWLDKQPGSAKAKQAMLEVRKSLDNDLMRAHNRMAAMSELSDSDIADHRTTINHQHNYFPHHRYGQWYVQAKVGDEVVFRQHFDATGRSLAKKKAAEIIAEQRKNYPKAAWRADENEKLPEDVYGAPLDMEAMEQVIKAATSRIGDKEQAESVRAALHEAIADTLKGRGFGSHAIGRKGIPGHEDQDVLRVLYDYKSGLSGWLTKMEAAKDFTEALGKIDARKHPTEWGYAAQYVKDMLRNFDKIDRLAGNIKSVAFAWYLGANLKTAAVNLTQNVITGVPRLEVDTVGGAGYMRAAMDAIVDQVTGRKGKGLTQDEAQLLRDMYDNAIITDGYMEEVRGRVSGVDGAAVWNKLLKGMGWFMSVAERFNRASLALAAYRAARSGKLKQKAQETYGIEGKANYEQAKAYAETIVRDAHFVYGKANLPEALRSSAAGRAISPAYTFRAFSHNLMSLWGWALRTQGRDGAKMVAKGLSATLLIGGVASAPFFATAMALFQAMSGDDDDWLESVRGWTTEYLGGNEMMRDVVSYGIPAAAGVNLGGSLKMETPFSQGLKKGSTPKEVLTESIGDVIGIPYDLFVQRPTKVMDAYKNRNVYRMVEEASPTFVQNAMRAWRLHDDGQKAMSGRAINDPGQKGARKLTEAEAIGKLLGFQPASATKSYDRYSARQHSDKVRSDKSGEFAARMLNAKESGNTRDMVKARKDLRQWNEEMREDGKVWMVIKQEDVQRRMAARRRENKLTGREKGRVRAQSDVWGS